MVADPAAFTAVKMSGEIILRPDLFFDACDEYGLLVWQDLSRTSATGEHSATRWDAHPKKCDSLVYMDNMIDFISRARGQWVDRTVTWTQKNAKWQELLSLPAVDLEAMEINRKEIENEMVYGLKIHNQASVPAVNIMLELTDRSFGKEILPAFWSDNALTLMPGETRTVEVKVRKDIVPDQVHVVAEGLNVAPVSWNVFTGLKKEMEIRIENMEIRKDNDRFVLHFSASQPDNCGTRITTGPVKLTIDGKLYRYVSVAVKEGMSIDGRIELPGIKPGKHVIELGNGKNGSNFIRKHALHSALSK